MEEKIGLNKRLVIITDTNLNDEATGMAQTLANLFDNYPKGKLLFCTPQKCSGKFKNFKSLAYEVVWANKLIRKLFAGALKQYFKKISVSLVVKKILHFQPQIVIISNLDYKSCLITNALLEKQNILLCVYLMDYISKDSQNEFDALYDPLIKKATKHIFISKYMANFYTSEYPNIKNYTVIHNPVSENEIGVAPVINDDRGEINFAYAGSLWQMHFDALILFAKALRVLQKKGVNVKLTIYTASHFYKMHKQVFEELSISYGGFFRYDKLKPRLKQHHALLVASSFDEKFYGLSAYSVQTKVTDYLATGVPVISIGPAYAACNKFINENNGGFVIKTDNEEEIVAQIESYLKTNYDCLFKRAGNGLRLIREKYKKDIVQNKLYRFLAGEKN